MDINEIEYDIKKRDGGGEIKFFYRTIKKLHCLQLWINFKLPLGTYFSEFEPEYKINIFQGFYKYKHFNEKYNLLYSAYGFTFFFFGFKYAYGESF